VRQAITHIREYSNDSNRCTSCRRKSDTHDIRAPDHVWQPLTKLQRGQNRSATPGMKSWFQLGSSGPVIVLGYLILSLFCQPWSSGYDSSKCPPSYIGLLDSIFQYAVSIVRYLINRAKMMRSSLNTDGGCHLGASNIHIPLLDLFIRWNYAFP
jgi:hypothetical protein